MQNEHSPDPDWDTPLQLTTTPALLIHALFGTASTVHTGWESCVDNDLAMSELTAMDEVSGNYCRLVEQEYEEDEKEEAAIWHDWAVELRLGTVLITGHWQMQLAGSPADWEWCIREAEKAFDKACALLGKRTRRGVGVEEPQLGTQPPTQRRH